jgi:hypothetical protein
MLNNLIGCYLRCGVAGLKLLFLFKFISMKQEAQVHILPTGKPSRLVKFFTNKFHLCKEILPIQDEEQYQNIYITSDEEIKEGDWIILSDKDLLYKVEYTSQCFDYNNDTDCKKIILTDNEDLIKDGVQAIPDEFLEWFVENLSCEEVKIKKLRYDGTKSITKYWGGEYTVILPQDETKQRQMILMNATTVIDTRKPKQETLEELCNKINFINPRERVAYYNGLTRGAIWQAEKMYSEEDMKLSFEAGHNKGFSGYPNTENWKELPFKKWFEQIKKK